MNDTTKSFASEEEVEKYNRMIQKIENIQSKIKKLDLIINKIKNQVEPF